MPERDRVAIRRGGRDLPHTSRVREPSRIARAQPGHEQEPVLDRLLGALRIGVEVVHQHVEPAPTQGAQVGPRGFDPGDEPVVAILAQAIPLELDPRPGVRHAPCLDLRRRGTARRGGSPLGRRLGRDRPDRQVVEEDLRLARPAEQVDDQPVEVCPFEAHRAIRGGAEHARLPLDRRPEVHQVQSLPAIGRVVDRARYEHERRLPRVGVGVRRQDDPAQELDAHPIRSDIEPHLQRVGHDDLWQGIAVVEGAARPRLELDPLRAEAFVPGAVRAIVRQELDRGIGDLAAPDHPGAFEAVVDRPGRLVLAPERGDRDAMRTAETATDTPVPESGRGTRPPCRRAATRSSGPTLALPGPRTRCA